MDWKAASEFFAKVGVPTGIVIWFLFEAHHFLSAIVANDTKIITLLEEIVRRIP